MTHERQHWHCPEANPHPAPGPRPTARLLRPMGDVKTIYYRKDGRWLRAGWLCLDCLLFVPDPKFGRPTFSPIYNSNNNKMIDGKKGLRGVNMSMFNKGHKRICLYECVSVAE